MICYNKKQIKSKLLDLSNEQMFFENKALISNLV